MNGGDQVIIRGLDLPVCIGVPDAERSGWQNISADITLTLCAGFEQMADEIAATVDYEAVANAMRALASSRPRKLLETLAAELCASLLDDPKIAGVELELKKRILPGVDHVAVRMARRRS